MVVQLQKFSTGGERLINNSQQATRKIGRLWSEGSQEKVFQEERNQLGQMVLRVR